MDNSILYNPIINSLFVDNFDSITKKYQKDNFNLKEFEKFFDHITKKLSDENIKVNDFINLFYIYTFLYLNYTNYLVYISHPDINDMKIEKIARKVKVSNNIVKNIFKFSSNENIQKIIKLNNPFIINKIKNKINSDNIDKYIKNYILDIKQLDKISELSNDNFKKILSLILYRYITCKNNNFENYHCFYIKKIAKSIKENYNKKIQFLDFEHFINQIPQSKKILNIIVNKKIEKINEINIIKIINFVLNKNTNKNFYVETSKNNEIIIKNKEFDGIIKINISNIYQNIEFNQYQTNYKFLHYSVEQLKEFNFLKNTFSNIEINIFDSNLKDLSSILEFMHLLVISLKITSSYPSDLYECLYPVEYKNYYYDSFIVFFEFFKREINNNYFYNKFIVDVIKFFYIYSYYDYYFYYKNSFMDLIVNKLDLKNELFNDFMDNLKNTLKLPKELISHPPFFKNDFDINSVIYYNFEIPSYFKLYDILNAITNTFDKNLLIKNNKIDIIEIILMFINFDNKNTYTNSITKSITVNSNFDLNSNNNYKKKSKSEKSNSSEESEESDGSNDSDISKEEEESSSSETSIDLSESEIITKSKKSNINSKKKELESNLDTEIINNLTKEDMTRMENPNTYIELNLNPNMSDCILNTEI
jgi:hypothetical protein